MGLWFTIMRCEQLLRDSKFSYEFNVVVNGESGFRHVKPYQTMDVDLEPVLEGLHKDGRLNYLKVTSQNMTPQKARQLASDRATGDYLFFFDNHCLAEPGYFERAMFEFTNKPIDLLHSGHRFYVADPIKYHYILQLEKNFWGHSAVFPPYSGLKAYRVGSGAHGGFAVTTKSWREVGGYGHTIAFTGYAGEEVYTGLLYNMLGKKVWVAPQMVHSHWPGRRVYARHFSPDYYRNLLSCAYLIGGEKWLYKVYDSFQSSCKYGQHLDMFQLLVEAYERSRAGHIDIKQRALMTLDDLLLYFIEKQIEH